jgi:hypothetical protein
MKNTQPSTSTLHPAWDTARGYLAGIQQAFRMSIAGQVLLGLELMAIKKDLGFTHGANKGGPSGQFVHTDRTWSEWVTAELGISYKTADRMILMGDAARTRLKKIGHSGDLPGGAKKLALIIDARPATLAEEDRERLASVVERITDGATQASLLEELRLVKKHSTPPDTTGLNNRGTKESDPVEQMAFTFWLDRGNQIMEIRATGSQFLNMLPIESSDPHKPSLRTLHAETTALLDDINAAINANLKPAKGRSL